ncbi:MAG: 4-hydroxy-tetrahydrodipicolinate synthase [Nitriliruptoraceae bacterium]
MAGRTGVDAVGRVVTAMVTPFTADGALDVAGVATLAAHLVATGSDGIVVGGTTGESPTLRDGELWDVVAAVRDTVGDRARVVVGTGTNDTARTVERTLRAAEAGADAALVVTPYYNRPSQAGLRAHFRAVAASTELPLLLYDIPARTGRELGPSTLVDLAEVPTIVGVKDATGDLGKAGDTLVATAGAPGGFAVWSGSDEVNLPLLALGAVGVVSVAAHLVGPELAEMVRVAATDPGRARTRHRRCRPRPRARCLAPNPGPLTALLAARGLPAGPVRGPLAAPEPEVVAAGMAALGAVEAARGDVA